jgi:DNA (cytosine-5)-methyltransferase 1
MTGSERPRLLDLYCGEGGASIGYARTGFEVVGVDTFEGFSQSRYPFESHRSDALEFLAAHGDEFDVVHASPPCQHASAGTRGLDRSDYPRLIEPTRALLQALGCTYVIENVRGAELIDPVELCGCMFDLASRDDDGEQLHLRRARGFEVSVPLGGPPAHDHQGQRWVAGSYGGARRDKHVARELRHGGYVPAKPIQQALLGIDWMSERGMHQSVPPAYTEWIGRQLMSHLRGDATPGTTYHRRRPPRHSFCRRRRTSTTRTRKESHMNQNHHLPGGAS